MITCVGVCPGLVAEPDLERRQATLESIALGVLESFPLQVNVTLRGVVPDACTRVESVVERFEPDERTYHLEVEVVRATDEVCAQVLTPFEITVPLVKAGLASGRFDVVAHGLDSSFEIESLGEFPGFDLPSPGSSTWLCSIEPRMCFSGPEDWTREGMVWSSSPFLSARIGFDSWPWEETTDPADLVPDGAEIHERNAARLGWTTGTRLMESREAGEVWTEHVFARCGAGTLCEFWVQAPTEPLLDAAGEPFWRMVRFATQY